MKQREKEANKAKAAVNQPVATAAKSAEDQEDELTPNVRTALYIYNQCYSFQIVIKY